MAFDMAFGKRANLRKEAFGEKAFWKKHSGNHVKIIVFDRYKGLLNS